ncbi:MAG: hypothetical protein R3F23_07660 [Verrucomicrobiia bacterium]
MNKVVLFSFLALSQCLSLIAAPPKTVTAMKAKEIATGVLDPATQQRIIAIRGLRSMLSPVPVEWLIWFYDPNAIQNGRRVRVSSDNVTEIKEGFTEIGHARLFPYQMEEVIPSDRLQVDSDEALARVMNLGPLKGKKVTSSVWELKKAKGNVPPLWYITLFTEVGGKEKTLAKVRLSAEDGRLIELNLAN